MATLMQKVRVVLLGHAHDLLDKSIDMSSPSALRQYVRDLEEALQQMETEGATQAGMCRTYAREKADLEAKIATTKVTITTQLSQKKDDLARANAARVVQFQAQLEHKAHDLASQQEASAKTDKAIADLRLKHDTMVSRLRELENLDTDTKIKEKSAAALSAAGKLVSGGADLSVDSIEGRMRARNDVASEQFDRAMGTLSTPEDTETASQVDNLLASLQPKTASVA